MITLLYFYKNCYRLKKSKLRVAILFFMFSMVPGTVLCQVPELPSGNTEQQLENITENTDDAEMEDDTYLQQMKHFIKNPININKAEGTELKELRLLTPIQINNLINYRNLFGAFIDIYELQAVPGWSTDLLQKIRLYITVSEPLNIAGEINNRFKNGEHSLLLRVTQVLQKSKGYLLNPSSTTNYYSGSPQKYFTRYKYQFKNLLQYGLVGEKDAGEQFFKGNQKKGFDFYSAHFFARNIGIIKAVALGDYTVNLGQGLIHWQNLAFKKSADVINIKRESAILRPYNAAGEINFHRGIGLTLGKRDISATVFGSYKKVDANFVADTSQTQDDFISSLQTSGYHRTASEIADKAIQQQMAFGGNISYNRNKFHLGLNTVQYKFKYPIKKSADPYNIYALSGKNWGNYSIDYSFTRNNFHFFGEAAIANAGYKAFINGLLISTASSVDMSFLYRNISKDYQALYTTAFTENTYPTNEKGFYTGLSIHPGNIWRIDAYADFFRFPWLRFRVDAPSNGTDYLIQLTYKPNKVLEIYSRYRSESKAINNNPGQQILSPVVVQPKQNWRTQFLYKINSSFTVRSRVEMLWFNRQSDQPEEGFLTYFDFLYKPMLKSWAANVRLQYFETDSYNSRLYAYENDVLYSFSIPVFYDKGMRYYVNFNYDINNKLTFWARWATLAYKDKTVVGSGLDEIVGKKKTEIKIQLLYHF